jgi:hypothetical protein
METRSMTLSEMALEMGMSEADLKNRLEMMASMGHLEAITIDSDNPDPEADCPGCVMASKCRVDDCSDGVPVVGYRLTDKGRRLAQDGGN